MNDSHALEEAKKPRVMGDIPMELIDEVMSTITDPAAMLGPEVSKGKPEQPAGSPFLSPTVAGGGGITER